jgi:hypothetical protein
VLSSVATTKAVSLARRDSGITSPIRTHEVLPLISVAAKTLPAVRYEPRPAPAGDYDHAIHIDHPEAPSLLEGYLASPAQARAHPPDPNGRKPAGAEAPEPEEAPPAPVTDG